jgi:hypothetical protein
MSRSTNHINVPFRLDVVLITVQDGGHDKRIVDLHEVTEAMLIDVGLHRREKVLGSHKRSSQPWRVTRLGAHRGEALTGSIGFSQDAP